jgi:hypothetical protein
VGVFCEFRPAGEFCGWFCFVSDEGVEDALSDDCSFPVCVAWGELWRASVSGKFCGFVTF